MELNWSGTYRYRAGTFHRPRTFGELRVVVSRAKKLHALGTRHSFNDISDSAELVSLAAMPGKPELDSAGRRVRVPAATRYGDLALYLDQQGWALANLASLPHICVAGSVATATHGSGSGNQSLASSVTALTLMTGAGDIVNLSRDEPGPGSADFAGAVVHLGALGVVTEVELAVEPTYEVRQNVYEDLPWESLDANFDEVLGAGYSVSVMTDFAGPSADLVWVKERLGAGEPQATPPALFGAQAATTQLHPTRGNDPVHCTPQLGLAGPWYNRLPHFLLEFTPSTGSEIQSEYLFDRRHGAGVIEALRGLGPSIGALVKSAEIRTVAADELWLSPAYGVDSAAVHFTWQPNSEEVQKIVVRIETALEPFAVRPHWAKVFGRPSRPWDVLYPRLPDFWALARSYDPDRKFTNAFLDRTVFS
jgi:alditol oxidase